MSVFEVISGYAHLINEVCAGCGTPTNKRPYCSKCGTFNVLEKPNKNTETKLSTKHKNPLGLLDCSVKPENKGLTHGDILALRYRLSEMVSGTPVEEKIEQEFDQKVVPLLIDGTISDQFFDLWAEYWGRFLSITEGFSSKIAEIENGNIDLVNGLDFSDALSTLLHMLRNELDKSIHDFMLDSDNLLPLLKYAKFAEKCISNFAWLQAGICAINLCINTAEMSKIFEKENEINRKIETIVRNAIIEQHSVLTKNERYLNALNVLKDTADRLGKLSSLAFAISSVNGCVITYAQERLNLIKDELLILIKNKYISVVNVDAWLRVKLIGFTGLRSNDFSEIDLTSIELIPTESIDSIYKYVDGLIKYYDDLLRKIQSKIQHCNEWGDDVLVKLNDESERHEAEERIRIRREEEEIDRCHQTRLLRDMQEQFLTRQISLRQKAEGRYFLSIFTEALGADAGTFWEGVTSK